MTKEIDDQFREIMAGSIEGEADDLLSRQLEKVQLWRQMFAVTEGREPTLHDLILKMMESQAPRPPVIVMFATAVWKLLEEQ